MSVISGIHIFTDKKAKVLINLKASLRGQTSVISDETAKKAKELLSGEGLSELLENYSDSMTQECAIVLFDDYVSAYFEEKQPQEIAAFAASCSESFAKPVVFTVNIDNEVMIVGIANEGVVRSRLVFGENAEEYDLSSERINMDYLMFIFNSRTLSDLNECRSCEDIAFCLEEDYGIMSELSPMSMILFEDKYKLLERNEFFSVYSTLE